MASCFACLRGLVTPGRTAAAPPTDTSLLDVEGYYRRVTETFRLGSLEMMDTLFADDITEPMTKPAIQAWAQTMFQNEDIVFSVDAVRIEEQTPEHAVAVLTFHVTVRGGRADFAGVERDWLRRRADGTVEIYRWVKLQ